MNRNQRRRTLTPVEEYRVPEGHIALTFDFEDYTPSTIAIETQHFADIVAQTGKKICADWTYEKTLSVLGDIFRAWKKGKNPDARSGLLLGYWVALNHPRGGEKMRRLIADRMANNEPVHITLFGARKRGIAIALGERFVDLARPLQAAKNTGVQGFTWESEHPERKGGVQ